MHNALNEVVKINYPPKNKNVLSIHGEAPCDREHFQFTVKTILLPRFEQPHHFMKLLLLLLFFRFSSSSSTFPYREVLSLKTLHRKCTTSTFERSYIFQRIISLFGTSDDSALVLLRDTILNSVMEEVGDVLQQGKAFSKLVIAKSEGMVSGLYKKENGGLELSMELEILFQGTGGLASVKQFMANASKDHFRIASCKDKSVKKWQLLAMLEAVMAWKQFTRNFEYIPCSNKLTKALNSNNSMSCIRERMDMYLNSYERFLKPIVHQFDLGNSYARLMTVYNFFQYLHQISRLFAMYLTSDQVERLKLEHQEFIEDSDVFVSTITLQRTMIGSIPFDGLWLFDTKLENGMLVPSKFKDVGMVAQYKTHMPLLRVSLYRVNRKHEKHEQDSPLDYIRLLIVEGKYLELTIHIFLKDWNEVWLENLVRRLKTRLSAHKDIMEMICSN